MSSQFQTVKNESPPQPLLPNLGAMTQQGRQDLTKILQDIGNQELHVKIVRLSQTPLFCHILLRTKMS